MLPDLFEWLEPPFTVLRPFTAAGMRMEEYVEKDRFVVRAEMPGVDPEKQVEVSVSKGILTIHAERQEAKESKRRSEFHYGSFTRHVVLPASADEADIMASYDNGIIEVSVGLHAKAEDDGAARRIPVRTLQHISPT